MNRRDFLNIAASFAAYPALASTLAERLGLKSTASESEQDEPIEVQPSGESALTGTLNLDAFTDEEILDLLMRIQGELVDRGLHGKIATIPVGTYTAGVDLPAGKYTYESADYDINDTALAFEYGDLVVRDAQGNKIASYDVPNYGSVTYYLTLNEGDVMAVPRRGKLIITAGGLLFE